MGAINKFSKVVGFIRNIKAKKNSIKITIDDLVHPRFGINDTNSNDLKKIPNALQFLMYSKENDTLFI